MSLLGSNNKQVKNVNVIFGDYLKYNGNNDLTGDYSITPADFVYTATRKLNIKNILMYMQDSSQIHYELFGSIASLTNGLRFWYKLSSSSNKIYLDAGYPLKTNGDFGKISFDVTLKEKGAGENVFVGQLDFKQAFDDGLMLEKGGSIGITVNDNLSGVGILTMFVKGNFSNQS